MSPSCIIFYSSYLILLLTSSRFLAYCYRILFYSISTSFLFSSSNSISSFYIFFIGSSCMIDINSLLLFFDSFVLCSSNLNSFSFFIFLFPFFPKLKSYLFIYSLCSLLESLLSFVYLILFTFSLLISLLNFVNFYVMLYLFYIW